MLNMFKEKKLNEEGNTEIQKLVQFDGDVTRLQSFRNLHKQLTCKRKTEA